MSRRVARAVLVLAAAFASWAATAQVLDDARFDEPVDRYGHFAPGHPHEYARLSARTATGRRIAARLDDDEVFEDVLPRSVRTTPGGPDEWLVIVSQRDRGSRLVLFGLDGERLAPVASSAPIGTPHRWLNPVGVADLDGDGRIEIAAVVTPHAGGTLKVYRRDGARLVEVASLADFSNHVYGTPELRLSTIATIGGRVRLLVPDAARRALRIVAFENGRLLETGRCALPGLVTGPVEVDASSRIVAMLSTGPWSVAPDDCAAPRGS